MQRTWTDEDLRKAVETNTNLTDVLASLKLNSSGASFRNIRRHLDRLCLDISHFKPKSKGPIPKPLQEIAAADVRLNSTSAFRKRLLRDGLLENQCSLCGLSPEWNGRPLTLQLDHIDGDPRNNQIINLRIVCPNCHSQTPTFGALNRKAPNKVCVDCGQHIQRRSTRCSACLQAKRRSESTTVRKVSSSGRVRYYKASTLDH